MATTIETVKASSQNEQIIDVVLDPIDNRRLANLSGQFGEHLQQIERIIRVEINNRGNAFRIKGKKEAIQKAAAIVRALYDETAQDTLSPERVQLLIQEVNMQKTADAAKSLSGDDTIEIYLRHKTIKARGANQALYVKRVRENDINFGIGPAGTGKTYLAVANAVEALEKNRVRRLILARPAVEAGEKLGFLPGDLSQKIDPYLRPLYDALYEMMGFETVEKLIERNIIEVAPLAFMRGRTLNEAFVILDEAQNTTTDQMKMFLTRIGFGSTVVVNGDITQTDLPISRRSGLQHAVDVLKGVEGISFTHFSPNDVVRHPLVQRVVSAYEKFETKYGKK
jgi:phosphate starvation-inducible PhoH-like protein